MAKFTSQTFLACWHRGFHHPMPISHQKQSQTVSTESMGLPGTGKVSLSLSLCKLPTSWLRAEARRIENICACVVTAKMITVYKTEQCLGFGVRREQIRLDLVGSREFFARIGVLEIRYLSPVLGS